jgi:hypothetical protein
LPQPLSHPPQAPLCSQYRLKDVSPEVHFFSKCAAIFPYFDETGRFNVTVFENGTEISLSQFIAKYKKDSVHLTRVESSTRFFPQ